MGFQKESRSTGLSLDVHAGPVATSLINKQQTFDERSLPFKKRSRPRQELLTQTANHGGFSTFLDEEADYCYCSQKIQLLERRLRKVEFACQGGLATMKAIKKCQPSSVNHENKIKKVQVIRNEELEQFIKGETINGADIKLVIQKKLFPSDLNPNQNRLNIPAKKLVAHDFLKANEKRFLETRKQNEIEVRLVGPTLQMYDKPMKLKMWEQRCTYNYVLITNWKHFVADNKEVLKEGTEVQVWPFRRNEQLCFPLVVVG